MSSDLFIREKYKIPTDVGYYYGRSKFSYHAKLYEVNSNGLLISLNDPNLEYVIIDYNTQERFKDFYWIGPINISSDILIKTSLLKCPICNSHYIDCEEHEFFRLVDTRDKIIKYTFKCRECYLQSPLAESEEKAAQAWNELCKKLQSNILNNERE